MYKKILLFMLLSISNIAVSNAGWLQPILSNIEDVGTAARPKINLSWLSLPSTPEDDNILLCRGGGVGRCYYGLMYIYQDSYEAPERTACLRHGEGGACMLVHNSSGWGGKTLKAFKDDWVRSYGSSGQVNGDYWTRRPYKWRICFGYQDVINLSPVEYSSCQIVPEAPVSCSTSSDTIDLQHGTLSSTELNSLNSQKSITKSLTISCSRQVSVRFDLLQSEINLTDGLTSNLTMKYNDRDVNSGGVRVISNGNGNFSITSTLSAVGNITPNTYSGSTILIMNLL
nr:hypothetical protein [uncultured Moellerella sp.]